MSRRLLRLYESDDRLLYASSSLKLLLRTRRSRFVIARLRERDDLILYERDRDGISPRPKYLIMFNKRP